MFYSINRRERLEDHWILLILGSCNLSAIRGDFTGASSKPFTHIHELKSSTRSNSGFIFLLKDSLWSLSVPSAFDGSDQICDLWITGVTVTASLAPVWSPNYAGRSWKSKTPSFANNAVQLYEAQWRRDACAQVRVPLWVRARAPNSVSSPRSVLFLGFMKRILTLCVVRWLWDYCHYHLSL